MNENQNVEKYSTKMQLVCTQILGINKVIKNKETGKPVVNEKNNTTMVNYRIAPKNKETEAPAYVSLYTPRECLSFIVQKLGYKLGGTFEENQHLQLFLTKLRIEVGFGDNFKNYPVVKDFDLNFTDENGEKKVIHNLKWQLYLQEKEGKTLEILNRETKETKQEGISADLMVDDPSMPF